MCNVHSVKLGHITATQTGEGSIVRRLFPLGNVAVRQLQSVYVFEADAFLLSANWKVNIWLCSLAMLLRLNEIVIS